VLSQTGQGCGRSPSPFLGRFCPNLSDPIAQEPASRRSERLPLADSGGPCHRPFARSTASAGPLIGSRASSIRHRSFRHALLSAHLARTAGVRAFCAVSANPEPRPVAVTAGQAVDVGQTGKWRAQQAAGDIYHGRGSRRWACRANCEFPAGAELVAVPVGGPLVSRA